MDKVPTFEYHFDDLRGRTSIFPEEIESDSWVQYHGTSSSFERAIDREGLRWKPAIASREDIECVVRIFGSMNWYGESGALSDLTAYSLRRLRPEGENAVYFRETPWRCLGYAMRDWAGGETVYALWRCFIELQTYLRSQATRKEHMVYQITQMRQNFDPDYPRERVIEVDLQWLRNQLATLQPLKRRCRRPYLAHKYGVIYAVKFTTADFAKLKCVSTAGQSFAGELDAKRLHAKARIYGDIDEDAKPFCALGTYDRQSMDHSSLLAQLDRYLWDIEKKERQSVEYIYDWAGVELDPTAGRDIASEIDLT